ncbi:MAG: DNA methyltransferase C1 [Fimbriimonadales bacterium]|nr:MAG: DNA methyltransferase C1 [Fimbriimonadales bacterium]
MVESRPVNPLDAFKGLTPDARWAFWDFTQRQTGYVTHSYHRYPAKFIPQLAARLIETYSRPGECVIDPFMGSGTTLVEAKLLRRPCLGVDINPVAYWVARAKTQAIEPSVLEEAQTRVSEQLRYCSQLALFDTPTPVSSAAQTDKWHERLHYWFPSETLHQLSQIQRVIDDLENEQLRTFFYCALSHILKSVSYWHDRSVKPMRRLDKPIPDARVVFLRHARRMARGNREFWDLLRLREALETPTRIYCADARCLPVQDESATLIVTSPPYVTSYEYADLHQLSVLWFGWATDQREFREQFIGRSNGVAHPHIPHGSSLAERIIGQIGETNPRKAREVALYFGEMRACFVEMRRVLRPNGSACIVIGNTHLCGVEVQNAQVFAEQLYNLGFRIERVILREIPSKILPRTRDKATGKFAKTGEADYIAYPTEYILIARKIEKTV